ncbi:unnamed protein product, partial [Discosporangium mesarthrocarpum]
RTVKWFPEYGCALLAIGHATAPDGPAAEHRRLFIIGLDSWEFEAHWYQNERLVDS